MAEGEFALVRQHLEEALRQTGEWVGEHDLYAMLADSAAQQRDEDALRYYAPLAEESAARYGHVLYQAIAQRAQGVAHRLAGDYAQAEARFLEALDLCRGLDTRWQIGRTLFELGELEQAQMNPGKARDHFSSAMAEFEKLRAVPDLIKTQKALEALDGRAVDQAGGQGALA